MVIERRRFIAFQNLILRMHDFQPCLAAPCRAVNKDPGAAPQCVLLCIAEVEKTQINLTCSIANADQHRAPPSHLDLRELYLRHHGGS